MHWMCQTCTKLLNCIYKTPNKLLLLSSIFISLSKLSTFKLCSTEFLHFRLVSHCCSWLVPTFTSPKKPPWRGRDDRGYILILRLWSKAHLRGRRRSCPPLTIVAFYNYPVAAGNVEHVKYGYRLGNLSDIVFTPLYSLS